ncbi:uncharacterized protein HKW66_Vig0117870 [Vigna angularis]|uniref:Uncharacterized protein n=1 Tax=Phaseolus angularis TaxID=3914 RepID=A0A8T0JW85_PHAAN|nr:uncharacterized protein HKW66_Vig0117870 [Vigna angularis]
MDNIEVSIHHGGKFVNDGCMKYKGESETMYFDPDLWNDRLEALCDDVGAMHMVNLAHLNGQVHLYVVCTISQPDVIPMIEYNVDEGGEEVAPQVNEGGEGAQFAEGIDDGLRKQLDEGVDGDGERIKAHDVGQAEMTQAAEDEGERIEVDEGDVERTKENEERIEVEEADVEGERTKADQVEFEGERIEIVEADGERTTTDEVQEERIEGQKADVEAKRREVDEVEVEVGKIEVEEADGERTTADEVQEDEGERIEVEEGDAERTTTDEMHEEIIEVEEADIEAERIEAHDGEGHRLDGEGYRIEVQDLEDIEVVVCDWSTSRDDDDGQMNSEDGLVDINVQCDVSHSSSNLEVEVEPVLLGNQVQEEGQQPSSLPEGEVDGEEPLQS